MDYYAIAGMVIISLIAISGFFGQHQFTQWGYVFALSVFSLIPILLVFIFCQKFFVAGLASGSVKG